MRLRKKCTACELPHMLDDLGRIRPEDEVEEVMCPASIRDVAKVLRSMGDKERELLLETTPANPLVAALDVAMDDAGVEVETAGAGRIAALCLLGAIILCAAAALGAWLF